MATSFNINVNDLQYILRQIKIAEATSIGYTSAPKTILQSIMDAYGVTAVNAAQLPAGLRTVDGTFNSLIPGQQTFGAADTLFPRLTDPVFRTVDGPGIDFNGDGIIDVVNHIYGDTNPAIIGTQVRSVADVDPRLISNAIVDMSVTNPAAIAAYLGNPLSLEQFAADHPGMIPVAPNDPLVGTLNYLAVTNADLLTIPNQSPDIGLSPGFNSWMTFFGQFFDHGLDLVTKGKNGTVYIPLSADDPLYDKGMDGTANTLVDAYFVTNPADTPVGVRLPAVSGVATAWQAFYTTDPAIAPPLALTATDTGFAAKFNDDGFGADGLVGTADDKPNFMALTRATVTLDANGVPQHENTTTAFVDQNQTYTSNSSHQVFLREYVRIDSNGDTTLDKTVSTGKLLDGTIASGSVAGAIGNWGEVKAQSVAMLGIKLSDFDVHNVPLLMTDQYGKFIAGANGYAQVTVNVTIINSLTGALVRNVGSTYVEGQAGGLDIHALTSTNLPGSFTLPILGDNQAFSVSVIGTGHAFLNDIAHHAAPGKYDADGDGFKESFQVADTDPGVGDDGLASTYDDEMLNAHFITGDGRGNENIALTTVHSIFHSEHNRLVEVNKATILESAAGGDLKFLNEWLITDVTTVPADLSTLVWDGERLFQAARFSTEMQYQHLVFEEFARRIQPMVDPFIFNSSPNVDPSIMAEFAHTVYRFGHTMLTGTVDRLENDLTVVGTDNTLDQKTLLAVFLNPQAYIGSGADLATINANIIRGLSRDVGNAIDEFIVTDVRSTLLGLPLDLAALNIARGRDTGIPSLNETRAQLYNDTGFADLKPYTSWYDFAANIKNAVSVVNFIAAYGTHASILAATTLADKRAAAELLVFGDGDDSDGVTIGATTYTDRFDFLNATGAHAGGSLGGLNDVDLWIGGLAEANPEFGGMLGTTFNYVFEAQMENLQNGDRLYYLTRTQGLNILNNLEDNTFSDIVMRNTALGDIYATHLSGALFITPDYILELDKAIAQEDYNSALSADVGLKDEDDPVGRVGLFDKVTRDYTTSVAGVAPIVGLDGHNIGGSISFLGGEHVVLGGTEGNDSLRSDKGIDTIWGDGGNDYINAGTESDDVFGGEGDDIIEDPFGDDVLRGNQGNDVITSARGADLLFGDEGKDVILLGQDAAEAFGGEGDDFILGGNGKDFLLGNEGNDWVEGGGGFDTIAGDNSELFFNSTIIGHDVLFNQADEGDYDAESGDDIMGSGASVFRYEGMFGFDWAIAKGDQSTSGVDFDMAIPIFTTIPNDILKDRFDQTEAFAGGQYNDKLSGDDRGHKGGGSSAPDSIPTELFADHLLTQEGINRIDGLNEWFGGNANGTMDGTDARQTLFGGASPVPGSAAVSTFRDGNILMGGDGNDSIRGRGGYDLIDGDAYLNVRIKIVIATGLNAGTYSAESLTSDVSAMGQYAGKVYNTDADGHPIFTSPAFGGRSLTSLLLDRTVNPADMSIVREILYDNTNVTGLGQNIDTAFFQGTMAEYEIEGLQTDGINYTGQVIHQAQDLDGDGFIFVRDRDTGAVGATIIGADGVTPVTLSSRGNLTDDRDLLKNIEQLQFADRSFLIGGPNIQATGTVTIADPTPFDGRVTPYVGQQLSVSSVLYDADNDGNLDGDLLDVGDTAITGVTYEWQTTEVGNAAGWSTITTNANPYTVRGVDPGHILRAVATFTDKNGITERVYSVATDNPTTAFSVNENSLSGTVVGLQIPFNVDYDSQSIGGNPPPDVDLATLHHEIDPANNAGGRFTVALNGVDFNGNPRYSLVVNNGGPILLDYEAPVHTLVNQSFQFVDNQYQVVVNTYDAPGGTLVAVRQFTILLNDIVNENIPVANAPTDINWNGVRPVSENALPLTEVVVANLSTVDVDNSAVTWSKIGGDANIVVDGTTGAVSRTGGFAVNSLYTLNVQATETANPGVSVTEAITIRTGTIAGNNGIAGALNGSGLTDVIYALDGNDLVNGLGGNDTLFGQAGNDTLNGGAGNDDLTGGDGNDTVNGGDNNDTIRWTFGDGNDTVNGGAGTDTMLVTGTAGGQTLNVVYNGTSITQIEGGGSIAGVELLRADLLGGIDTLQYDGTTANVTVNLTTGTASGFASIAGIENVTGGGGNDTLIGTTGVNNLSGGGGNDTIVATVDNVRDVINGNAGDDTADYSAYTSNLSLVTAAGVATALGGLAVVRGSGTTDVLSDTINSIVNFTSGSGNDTITGNGEGNIIIGNAGNDTINGGAGNDTAVFSGALSDYGFSLNVAGNLVVTDNRGGSPDGTDTLIGIENIRFGAQTFGLVAGTNGNNTLNGGANADLILGFNGADTINGGAGADNLTGGTGADIFDYNAINESGIGAAARDLITDFVSGTDKIDLSTIDARLGGGANTGDNAFTFNAIAGAGITGSGQLVYRYENVGTANEITVIEGNINNNMNVDFQIALLGHVNLLATDFSL